MAKVNLLLEEGWRAGQLFFCVAGLFVGLSLLDLWSRVPDWLHILSLVLFLVAAVGALYRAVREFHLPDRQRALAYIEARNRLAHRPLRSLGDHSEAETKAHSPSAWMWRLYQKSLRGYLPGLKVGLPRLEADAGDSYGARAIVILLLVVAAIIAGPRAGDRLYAAVTPTVGAPAIPVEVTAWLTPPAYTEQAPVLLAAKGDGDGAAKRYVVPAGSSFIAHIFGGSPAAPVLLADGERIEFLAVDQRNFQLEASFDRSMSVEIEKDGEIVAAWQLDIIPDEPPTVELMAEPDVTERSAFRLQYRAADDYGVLRIGGEVTRENTDEKIDLTLPTPGRGSKQVTSRSYHDLTAHPWAGLPVTLTLYAEDQLGQRGVSAPHSFVLPERTFTHPVAKVLIEQRKNLAIAPEENRDNTILVLQTLAGLSDTYDDDVTVTLALVTASAILRNSGSRKATDEASDILWETALRLENGSLSYAEAALRAAQEALMEALNRDASEEEIRRLMDELRTAMENFFRALAEQQPMEDQPPFDPESQDQIVRSQDLQRMLDRIEELARGGAKDAARELLSQLQDMMENLRMARPQSPSDSQREQQEMLNELGEMMRQQQQLLDETFRQSQGQRLQRSPRGQQQGQQPRPGQQPGQQGQQPGETLQDLAERQEALRRQLGDLMRRLGEQGEIPDALGRAERSMNSARDALEQGAEGPAIESEGNALESLRQGAQDLSDQMMQAGQGQGPQQAGPGQPGEGRDPLGRSIEEEGSQGNVSEGALMRGESEGFSRSRDIRNELQRRLSDPARPVIEKDYLRRLLDIL